MNVAAVFPYRLARYRQAEAETRPVATALRAERLERISRRGRNASAFILDVDQEAPVVATFGTEHDTPAGLGELERVVQQIGHRRTQ